MGVIVIEGRVSPEQMAELLEEMGEFVKLAVDVRRGVVSGGGAMHADCEAALLEHGSAQEDIWGADWYPDQKEVGFTSFINRRPRQGNRSMEIQDAGLKECIERIVRGVFQ